MNRSLPFRLVPLLAAALAATPGWAAPSSRGPKPIQLTYRGGPLIQHVQVATLFWGPDWKGSALTGYFNSFFEALFADGRYTANLA